MKLLKNAISTLYAIGEKGTTLSELVPTLGYSLENVSFVIEQLKAFDFVTGDQFLFLTKKGHQALSDENV